MPLFRKRERNIPLEKIKDDFKPRKLGDIPEIAISLGMIRPDHYEIYKFCDGNSNIENIARLVKKEKIEVKEVLKKLYKMALVEF